MDVPSSMSGITLNIHAIIIDGFFCEFNRKAAIFYPYLHKLGYYLQRVDYLTNGEANSPKSDKIRRELEISKKSAEKIESGMEVTTEETKESHMAPKANSVRDEGGELLEIRLFGQSYKQINEDSSNFLLNKDLSGYTHQRFMDKFKKKNSLDNSQAGSVTQLKMSGDGWTFLGYCGTS